MWEESRRPATTGTSKPLPLAITMAEGQEASAGMFKFILNLLLRFCEWLGLQPAGIAPDRLQGTTRRRLP